MSQARFQKQQREKARREKAAAKLVRREERRSGEADAADQPSTPAEQAGVLDELAALHSRFSAGTVSFEDFEAAREELTARLIV